MKKVIVVVSVVVMCANLSFAAEKMIVSGHFARAPFDWQEGDQLAGAGIEIIEWIFQDLGIESESRYAGPWKRVLYNLEIGTIDIMAGLYATEERKQFAEFTEPFSEDRVMIFVWRDRAFPFESWDDLQGKVFGDILGANRGEEFEAWRTQHATVEYVSDQLQNLKKLEAGRIDCFVASEYLGLMQIQQHGYEGKIVALEKPLATQYLRYGISKKSPFVVYLPQINQRLQAMREDGTIATLIQQNLEYYVSTYLKE